MSATGRPTKLTPEIQERIVNAIRTGNYLETAAEYGGVCKVTFYEWMKRGKKEKERLAEDGRKKVRQSERDFVNFLNAVTRARAEAEVRNVTIIQKAAQEDWRASAWYLEQSFQDTWGHKKQQMEHFGPGGGPLHVEVTRTIIRPGDEDEDDADG